MKKVRFQKPKVSFKDVVIIFFGVLFVVGFGFLLQFSMKENVDVKKQSPEKVEKLDDAFRYMEFLDYVFYFDKSKTLADIDKLKNVFINSRRHR